MFCFFRQRFFAFTGTNSILILMLKAWANRASVLSVAFLLILAYAPQVAGANPHRLKSVPPKRFRESLEVRSAPPPKWQGLGPAFPSPHQDPVN